MKISKQAIQATKLTLLSLGLTGLVVSLATLAASNYWFATHVLIPALLVVTVAMLWMFFYSMMKASS